MTNLCVPREEIFPLSAFLSLKGKYCMFKNLYSREPGQFQGWNLRAVCGGIDTWLLPSTDSYEKTNGDVMGRHTLKVTGG